MENFTNQKIQTDDFPAYQEVVLTPLEADYWKVVLINSFIFILILGIAGFSFFYFNPEIPVDIFIISSAYAVLCVLVFVVKYFSFKSKKYAFRDHDVIYQSGFITINTTIIPYNRVQHVTLFEGLVSKQFGLAKVGIFTAGGKGSDIEIPGIKKEEAERIKILLTAKILKQL
ncbi:MAG: PH domain-containing protein [Flavobacterium sp.]